LEAVLTTNENTVEEEALFKGLIFDEGWHPGDDLHSRCAVLASAFCAATWLDEESQLGPASRLDIRSLTPEDAERIRSLAPAVFTPEGTTSRVIQIDFELWITQDRENILSHPDMVTRVSGRLLVEEFWLQEEHVQNCEFGFPHLASGTSYSNVHIDGGTIGDALVPAATFSDYCEYLGSFYEEVIREEDPAQIVALAEAKIDLDCLDCRLKDVFLKATDKAKALLSEWESE
jgi:hypothetical protein